MAETFYVRGRSIDGIVYWDGNGWSAYRRHAKRVDLHNALAVVEARKERNREVDADSIIGRLTVESDQ